ncbi:MAG: hypothetical protein J3Q66DRAFT_39205 [Benniella sp.]|nr:MAG: hypothetical protein J3Q66DRAFT_39205 [Benniella sp.]
MSTRFLGQVSFYFLPFANHKTRRIFSKASTSSNPTQGGNRQQPAVLRKSKCGQHRSRIDPSEEKSASLRKALGEASRQLIHENTKKKVEKVVQSKRRKKTETAEEVRHVLKNEVAESNRVPYGLFTRTSGIYRRWMPAGTTPTNRLRREMAEAVALEGKDNDSSFIVLWTRVVNAEYDETCNHKYEQCTTPQQSGQDSSEVQH